VARRSSRLRRPFVDRRAARRPGSPARVQSLAGARDLAGSTIGDLQREVRRACQYPHAISPPSLIRSRLDQDSRRTPIDGSRRAAPVGRIIQELRPQREHMPRIHVRDFGRDLDLNLLRVFAVVAETGGITEAAKRLYLTQSAVSAALRRLTTTLGAPLFLRSGRGIALTSRGQRLRVGLEAHLGPDSGCASAWRRTSARWSRRRAHKYRVISGIYCDPSGSLSNLRLAVPVNFVVSRAVR
jgi:hypothetical protein